MEGVRGITFGHMRSLYSLSRRFSSLFFVWLLIAVLSSASILSLEVEASRVSPEASSYQHFTEGLLFDKLGEYEHARDAYRKALKTDSSAWDIHYRLALDYLRLKNFKSAEREFLLTLKLKPYDERVRYLLALAYSYRLKYKEAAQQFHKLLERPLLELNEQYIRTSLAYLYLMQKDLDKAQAEYQSILEKNPRDSDAHFYLGFIHAEFSNFDKAISEFSSAIEFNVNNAAALNSLSYVYAKRAEHLDKALVLIKRALSIEPSNGAFLDTLGWIHFRKGDLDNARRYLENASIFMREAEIFDHLGDVYLALGMTEKAKKNWQIALELDPKRKQVRDKIRQLKGRK